jgi:hypothetical protein
LRQHAIRRRHRNMAAKVTGASASLMQVIDPMTRGKDRLS